MSSNNKRVEEHKRRLAAAVALERPDRVPVVPLGNAFAAKVMEVKLADFAADPELAYKTVVKGLTSLGEIDGTQQISFNPNLLSLLWNSRVKIPGRELPEDNLWQVEEMELMSIEDYDKIIDKGYGKFLEELYRDKLDNPLAKVQAYLATMPMAIKEWEDNGVPLLCAEVCTIPYEALCGARSLQAFIVDLYRIPDKVEAAMQVMMPTMVEQALGIVRGFNLPGIWVGGWRSASEFLSRKLWERFVFPYYRQLVDVLVKEGVTVVLHFDSNWTRDLEYLREFPKGKCILATDGTTDIYKAKEVLGDHMCLMGDVSSQMLTVGTPDDVYAYASQLVKDLGPSGFILSSGCDIPYSAKPENVRAMIAAVH